MIITPAQRTAGLIRARKALGMTKRRRPMPRDRFPTLVAMEYTRALWRLFERVPPAFAELFAALPRILESARATRGDGIMWEPLRADLPLGRQSLVPSDNALRLDAGEGREVRDLVQRARENMNQSIDDSAIEAVAREFVDRTSTAQRKQILKQTRAAFGVEVPTTDAGIAGTLEAHVQANVGLIKGVTEDVAKKIEGIVLAAVQDGKLASDVQRDIHKVFGVGQERLQLIAVDQVGKAYSDVTFLRHQELGVKKFKWRTSRDSRVRGNPAGKYPKADPSHFAREGVVYSYDNLPKGKGGERERPGKPVRCRCTAEPVFDDIFEGLDDEPLLQPTLPAQRVPQAPAPAAAAVKASPKTRKPKRSSPLTQAQLPNPVKPGGNAFDATPYEDVSAFGGLPARERINADLRAYGLHNADALMPLRNKVTVQNDEFTGDGGAYHNYNGEIVISESAAANLTDFARAAKRGTNFEAVITDASLPDAERLVAVQQVDAYRLVVHEATHGHGPAMAGAYATPAGTVIEEAMTEVMARRVVRDKLGFGLDGAGSIWGEEGQIYAEHVNPLRDALSSVLSLEPRAAYLRLEQTALRYKRSKGLLSNAEEAIDRFVESIPLEDQDPGIAGQVRDIMRTWMRTTWP